MAVDIKVPTLGESVSEATVAKWFRKVGETVAADEPLVELETDKVSVEVPSLETVLLSLTGKELRDQAASMRERTRAFGRRGGEHTR